MQTEFHNTRSSFYQKIRANTVIYDGNECGELIYCYLSIFSKSAGFIILVL